MSKTKMFIFALLAGLIVSGTAGVTTYAVDSSGASVSTTTTVKTPIMDAVIAGLNKSIERLNQLKTVQQAIITKAKEKVEAAKTKVDEVQAKVEQKAAEVSQAKIDVQVKFEAKKLEWKQTTEAKIEAKKVALDQKLDTKKLEICNNNVTNINATIKEMNDNRDAAYTKVSKAFTAVQKYYTDKGLVVEDYPVLIAAAETAQAAANIAKAQQISTVDFKCETDTPYTFISQFKDKRSESVESLKLYRESVKKVVVATLNAAKVELEAAKAAGAN